MLCVVFYITFVDGINQIFKSNYPNISHTEISNNNRKVILVIFEPISKIGFLFISRVFMFFAEDVNAFLMSI